MHSRAYIRNGVTGWPPEKQEESLSEAGFHGPIYRDELARRDMRGKNASALKQRTVMLAPTAKTEPETILVASIRCFALNPVDLTTALAAAVARNATVRALDTGIEIGPGASVAEIAQAAQAFDKARKGEQTREGRARGNAVAAERARQRTAPKIAEARKLWGLPSDTISTDEISKRVGLSLRTLYLHLGRRRPAGQAVAVRKIKCLNDAICGVTD